MLGSAQRASPDADIEALGQILFRFAVAVLGHRILKQVEELVFEVWKLYPILRTFWPGDARLDGREIKLEQRAVIAFALLRNAEQPLRLVIISDRFDLRFFTSGR